jgi:hypothetical protein
MVKLVMLETLYQMLELHTTPAARRKFDMSVFSLIVRFSCMFSRQRISAYNYLSILVNYTASLKFIFDSRFNLISYKKRGKRGHQNP